MPGDSSLLQCASQYNFCLSIYSCFVIYVCLFYMQPLIASGQIIGAHGADLGVGIRLLSRQTLLQEKNFTGLEPRSLQIAWPLRRFVLCVSDSLKQNQETHSKNFGVGVHLIGKEIILQKKNLLAVSCTGTQSLQIACKFQQRRQNITSSPIALVLVN